MWLAVDKDGTESIYDHKPIREPNFNEFWTLPEDIESRGCGIIVPKGTAQRLLNYSLTWNNEAQEITEYKELSNGKKIQI